MENIEKIKNIAGGLGFDLFGVALIGEMEIETNALDNWASKKYYGDMNWFVNSLEKRKDILKVMPDAKSVICVAMNYYCDDGNKKEKNIKKFITHSSAIADECVIKNSVGKIARYARGRDYHKIFDKKLKLFTQKLKEILPENNFKYYSDTGPVLERTWAAKARLGFIGKNTNLITKYGSWVLLGEIITNIAMSDERLVVGRLKDISYKLTALNSCGSCHRCLDACPTGALVAPYTVDARKCISYLTIEHKGEIPVELREKMGNRIFGCDACQEICPFNIGRQTEGINFKKETGLLVRGSGLVDNNKKADKGKEIEYDLKEILSIKTDEEFLKKFAGSPIIRTKRRGLVRNACIAAGNLKDRILLPYLEECAKDKEPTIAEAARWAIKKLKKGI